MLDEIIHRVEQWSEGGNRQEDFSLPIIAYTAMGPPAFRARLDRGKHLFDIWDKHTAQPQYAAWRLKKIAQDLRRHRPDSQIRKIFAGFKPGATWHRSVEVMIERYYAGRTEMDQIERAGVAIRNIASELKAFDECKRLWEAMVQWEPLARALDRHTRGHARHVINVFWLGYYLINEPILRPIFLASWRRLLAQTWGMDEVADLDPAEAINNVWYFAALFHDVASPLERLDKVAEVVNRVSAGLLETDNGALEFNQGFAASSEKAVEELIRDLPTKLALEVRSNLVTYSDKGRLEHGVGAAVVLRQAIGQGPLGCIVRQAARAVAVHNIFPQLSEAACSEANWGNEPLMCLLLLCDQIQAWDRERGDSTYNNDWPERAELVDLLVVKQSSGPVVSITIDYIVQEHLERAPLIRDRVKDALQDVINANPDRCLGRIGGAWPFKVRVKCLFGDVPLSSEIRLG